MNAIARKREQVRCCWNGVRSWKKSRPICVHSKSTNSCEKLDEGSARSADDTMPRGLAGDQVINKMLGHPDPIQGDMQLVKDYDGEYRQSQHKSRRCSAMPRRKLPPNAPCPCDSGNKYKDCCYHKDFEWLVDDEGNVFKSIPFSEDLAEVIEEQRQKFVEQHGREPGPDDSLFFDMPPLEHTEHFMVQAMEQAGLHPAFVLFAKGCDHPILPSNRRGTQWTSFPA